MKRLLRVRLWHLLLMTAVIAAGLAFWRLHVAPYLDQQIGEQRVAEVGGRVTTVPASPQWLGRWIGRDRFHRVIEVHLEHCDVEDDDLRALHDLPFLRRLYLAGTPITDAGVRHLADLPHLRRLSLWRTNISDGCLKWVRRCQKLEALDIHDTCITDHGLEELRGLSRMTFLKLGGPIDGSGLRHVATLQNLQTLDLSNAWVGADSWQHLYGAELRTLVLRQSMPGSVLPTLAELPRLEELPYTRFENCTDADVAALADHPSLRSIDLDSTQLTDESMGTLATLPQLKELTIRGTLTDLSLQALTRFPSLNYLNAAGRFSPSQLRQTLEANPKLTGELRTAIPPGPLTQGRQNLRIKWLVTKRPFHAAQRHPRSRLPWIISIDKGAEIMWPASPADVADERLLSELTELSLRAPPNAGQRRLQYNLSPLADAEKLQRLQLYHLRPADLKRIGHIPNLTELRFYVRGLTDDDLEQLELPDSLQYCSFEASGITGSGIEKLLRRYPQVEIVAGGLGSVRSHGNYSGGRETYFCRDVGPATLKNAAQLPNIQSVDVEAFSETLDLSPLAAMKDLKRLQLLPRRNIWPVWTNYPPTLQLEELTIGPSQFSDAELASVSHPTAMRRLSLTGTRVSDSGLRRIARFTELRSLTIDGVREYWRVGGGAYLTGRTLSQIGSCELLESLSLQHTRVHDDYIDDFPTLPNLQVLQLDATDIGDATLAELVDKTPNLTTLSLMYTRVSDEGVKHLAKLPKLRELNLNGTTVTGRILLDLIDAPQLRILRFQIPDGDERYLKPFKHHRKDVQVVPR